MSHPHTRRDDLVDTLHGVEVPDPYRWLEDADSAEVQEWVAAQARFTEERLAELPAREWFTELMGRIVARPRVGVPRKRGGRWFVSRNDGTTPQDLWYTAPTVEELARGGEAILDPNTWSDDGTSSLSTFTVARDGSLMAYARSDGGSDWQRIRLLDLATGEELDDEVVAKFSTPNWLPDHRSFLYTTFDEAEDARGTATAGLGVGRLMIHRLDGEDELLLTFPDEPNTMAFGQVSHDDAWLIVTIVRGTEHVNRLWAYPITTSEGRSVFGEPVKVVDDADAEYGFVRVDGTQLYLHTDLDAPLGRLVRIDLAAPGRGFDEVVAESGDTLAAVEAAGRGMLLAYLRDAQAAVEWRELDGSGAVEIDLPAGALVGMDSSPLRDEAFVGLSTIDTPVVAFQIPVPERERQRATKGPRRLFSASTPVAAVSDTLRGPFTSTCPALRAGTGSAQASFAGAHAQAPKFTTQRLRATSADGTEVPYFLITPDDGNTGPRPTLLYGYGGFKIPVLADYRPGWSAWLAAGGALAIANLRGGGEFGTQWYDAGRLANKQNVFDDFIGVAEHLIASGATTSAQLAIHGRSNGGLLVGAALTQRPDLFAAALPGVGVLDLLRFHKFTIGAAWMSDYGDPGTPEGFAAAHAYSPLHNIREGVGYPPTLVLTADHDDRVVPLHSFKFAAALQHASSIEPSNVLLRVETSAGHGAGKSLQMIASEWADLLAFAAHHTGLRVGR
ncbi:prolyl oligopeptidase family serine peptidase [Tessaracoccus massiliensis]|uniref:prolyl oligopeptidase family serine peptidase n=1 Tax=Tessaracoccus massiliensis TaxID=1522311 RepID=UPI00058CCBF3|nr:prolyl oligopeptidase family serine peptidase [Tessaracoccus massiliensis]